MTRVITLFHRDAIQLGRQTITAEQALNVLPKMGNFYWASGCGDTRRGKRYFHRLQREIRRWRVE